MYPGGGGIDLKMLLLPCLPEAALEDEEECNESFLGWNILHSSIQCPETPQSLHT
jgi:hypothetical protein